MNTTTAAPPPLQPAAAVAGPATGLAADAHRCESVLCSHSIGRRLSRKLALFTMAVLPVLFTFSWFGVGMLIQERNAEDLHKRCALLEDDAPMRGNSHVRALRADSSLLYAGHPQQGMPDSGHLRIHRITVQGPALAGGQLWVDTTVDVARDAAIGRRWGWLMVLATLAAGAVVSVGARWHVQRQLRPLHDLAAQTRAISPGKLEQRLELSYAQLEGFNANVAHELRTPLANLMRQTEVVLSRDRPPAELCDTLASNLEEMQRLLAMVNDMLLLSQADRGAPVSLAALARQVVEFHDGALEEAGLPLRVQGDATLAVDESLAKRALSNLLGNATRFARHGSTVVIGIASDADLQVRVEVQNQGPAIAADALPRLFDRFLRADESRCCDSGEQHHGLGLAIVAAIARMHDGRTFAASADGTTHVGFTLAPG